MEKKCEEKMGKLKITCGEMGIVLKAMWCRMVLLVAYASPGIKTQITRYRHLG